MAITIDWGTLVINVPKADTTLIQAIPTEIRELNLNTFRLALKDLEDSEEGMTYPVTHNHNPPVVVGGVTLARVIEITNGYTILFEDGQYAVNLVGANSNISDVTIVNQVSIRSANSAGLTESGFTDADRALIQSIPQDLLDLVNGIESGVTLKDALRIMLSILAGKVSGAGTGTETFRDVNDTKNRVVSTVDNLGNRTNVTTDST